MIKVNIWEQRQLKKEGLMSILIAVEKENQLKEQMRLKFNFHSMDFEEISFLTAAPKDEEFFYILREMRNYFKINRNDYLHKIKRGDYKK